MVGTHEADDPIAWLVAHRDDLLGYACLMVSRDLADDVLQEAYLVVQRRRGDFEPGAPPGPWIHGIVRNLARKAAIRMHRSRTMPSDELVAAMDEAALRAERTDAGSDEAVALEGCLAELTGRHRQLVERRYRDGLSLAELAASVGATPGSVQVMLSRIRAALLACLQRRSGHGPA